MIHFSDVHFSYGDQTFGLTVGDLRVDAGERVAIVGPSGSGKTTLVNLASGVLVPQSGSITTNALQLTACDESRRRRFRLCNIGFVFQEFALLDYLSVRDNIRLPFLLGADSHAPTARDEQVAQLADSVGLGRFLDRYPRHLSFGERQRVAICRALIASPKIVVADEPTGNLDPTRSTEVLQILNDHVKQSGATLLMVTHNMGLLDQFDRTIDVTDFAQVTCQ